MKQISDRVVALTAKYGGLLWGNMAKDSRAEYSPAFFGETLYEELCRIKAVFDPNNRLNPGKICAPLMKVDAIKRSTFDRQIPIEIRTSMSGTMACNGNGLCFNFGVHSAMCPSMKITSNRVHSPKGRAAPVREWLRLLSEQGINPLSLEEQLLQQRFSFRTLIEKTAIVGTQLRASTISRTR